MIETIEGSVTNGQSQIVDMVTTKSYHDYQIDEDQQFNSDFGPLRFLQC